MARINLQQPIASMCGYDYIKMAFSYWTGIQDISKELDTLNWALVSFSEQDIEVFWNFSYKKYLGIAGVLLLWKMWDLLSVTKTQVPEMFENLTLI